MATRAVAGVGMILATCCLAQAPLSTDKGTISGTVTNPASEPLRRVSVQLMPLSSQPGAPALNAATETDLQGDFTFEDVTAGRYMLAAQRTGYLGASYYNTRGTVLTVDPGQKIMGIVIKMTPQSIIGGKVVDDDNDPLPGATVHVYPSMLPAELARTVSPVGDGKTDADGAFAIGGFPPGRYIVSVVAPPAPESPVSPPVLRKQQEVDVTTYYPEATDFAAATPVDVGAGAQVRGLVIRLRKVPVFKVSGKVINSLTGEPGSAVLNLFRRDGVPGLSARSVGVNAGDFSFDGIPPGNYVLETKSIGEAEDRPLVAWQIISVGNGDLDHVAVDMRPGVEVRGNVIADGKAPSSWPQITVAPVEGLNYPTDLPMVDANGHFTLSGLEPAPYNIYISAIPRSMFLKEIRVNGRDIAFDDRQINLTSERAASLEITISDRVGSINGTVSDSMGPVGPGIMVMANGKTQGRAGGTVTDENGRFSLGGLPPGDYLLTAMDTGARLGFVRIAPEVLQKVGKAVTVTEGASATLDLRLATTDDLVPDLR